ncbi:AMP-activated serine/threonine-protein kinase regulatory subunit [Coelomomyces lativittatus]|nr:AMP-activated serine/threonine-protein kinase regulatory subunit [Coelomomyces lativittatus]KAJ1505633.1 AMP-activated serine/threonine-protein kinase regulatory subunit [Coelomomyces lativittatus]KAJ1514117.1 AMP-activated serine/threonine-protein kinase regulatory subunit [Coelomomyces lativittatus]
MLSIKTFLQSHTPYDILPISLKVVAIDSTVTIQQCISILLIHGLTAAPIWNTTTQTFLGLFMVKDLIHLMITFENQRYSHSLGDTMLYQRLNQWLNSSVEKLRDMDANRIGLQPIHIHPLKSLEDATQLMIDCHLHHIVLIDADSISHQETLVSVLTGFKILKFIACNCTLISQLQGSLQELNIGTYQNLRTVKETSSLMDAVRIFQKEGFSSLPVVNEQNQLTNILTETDILHVLQEPLTCKSLDVLILTLLQSRSTSPSNEKIFFFHPQDTLAHLFHQLKSIEVLPHFMVVSPDMTLLGIISIGDLLKFIFERRKLRFKK